MTRTKSGKYPRWDAISLPDEDRQVRIVPFDSWIGRLNETPGNGCIRQRHERTAVVETVTDRVPAEAGEVWQQRILISRTAGEKALANVDIFLMCGGRWWSQWASRSIRSLPTTSLKCSRCPLSSRSPSAVDRPRPLHPAEPLARRQTMEEKQSDDWTQNRENRLPSFAEVLARRTRPPVDLFMF